METERKRGGVNTLIRGRGHNNNFLLHLLKKFEDANWRKMPAPKSDQLGWTCDQFGRTFKDFRGDGMQ
jgi:hypothetical protein